LITIDCVTKFPGPFFDLIHQDPIVSQVKLIAEPWDLGSGGYQVGNFPVLWTEWNGKYRDSIRGFWAGKGVTLSELATRIAGSTDLYYSQNGKSPYSSINFITCHDGMHCLIFASVQFETRLNFSFVFCLYYCIVVSKSININLQASHFKIWCLTMRSTTSRTRRTIEMVTITITVGTVV
jgi:hypothetical protein